MNPRKVLALLLAAQGPVILWGAAAQADAPTSLPATTTSETPAPEPDPPSTETTPAAQPPAPEPPAPEPAPEPAPTPPPMSPAPAPATPSPALDPAIEPSGSGVKPQRTTGEARHLRDERPAREKDAKPKKHRDARTESAADGGAAAPGGPGGEPIAATGLDEDERPTAGVPNFFIEKFRIPPFLLPIYQAAGIEYGIRWEVLAGINEIETDYGRNLSVSTAGALGWMQFMPSTWKMYGVDANRDGKRDPSNPVDAIFAAARYLRAAGADKDLRKAIFAYNHADWYVADVLRRARLVAALPEDLIGAISGLTQSLLPVTGTIDYEGALDIAHPERKDGDPASAQTREPRRSLTIHAEPGAAIAAVQDGKIVEMGTSKTLGRYIKLRDTYGNLYTYAGMGAFAERVPVPLPGKVSDGDPRAADTDKAGDDPAPTQAASDTTRADLEHRDTDAAPTTPPSDSEEQAMEDQAGRPIKRPDDLPAAQTADLPPLPAADDATTQVSETLPVAVRPAPITGNGVKPLEPPPPPLPQRARPVAPTAGQVKLRGYVERLTGSVAGRATERLRNEDPGLPDGQTFGRYFTVDYGLKRDEVRLRRLHTGQRVIAGTILGRVTRDPEAGARPTLKLRIRPAGDEAPEIDPKPILDGWRLLDRTEIYRARGRAALFEGTASVGQILLMDKQTLQRRVLADPDISIYECGRRDIRAGIIDRRVLAVLEFLVANGMKPTVTSLQCGHGVYTSSGNVSHHTTGTAVDIGAINGTVISPSTQGEGSVTDKVVRKLLTLQGTMKPAQIITLMKYAGTDNTLAMADHADHIHVGFRPTVAAEPTPADARPRKATLKPGQWAKLLHRLDGIENPEVPLIPSKYAITTRKER